MNSFNFPIFQFRNYNQKEESEFMVTKFSLGSNNTKKSEITKSLNRIRNEKNSLDVKSKLLLENSNISDKDYNDLQNLNDYINRYDSSFLLDLFKPAMNDSFLKFKNILCNSSLVEENDLNFIVEITPDSYGQTLKNNKDAILKLIKDYKYEFVNFLDCTSISKIEKQNLKQFYQKQIEKIKAEKEKKKQITNEKKINTITNDFTNNNNTYINENLQNNSQRKNSDNFQLFDKENNEIEINSLNITNPPKNQKNVPNFDYRNDFIKPDNENIQKYNDFRKYTNNQNLTDEQIKFYIQNEPNFENSIFNYFTCFHKSEMLNIKYKFSNSDSRDCIFLHLQDPNDLYSEIYRNYPYIIEFDLLNEDGSEIKIDPKKDKYMGALVKNNSTVYVKIKK